MENSKDKNKIFLIVGILLLLIALGLVGLDAYRLTKFERVEAMLAVRRGPSKSKKAYVTYEYQGTRHEDKVLASYNAFVMKNGKPYTILIDPASPDEPKTTSFGLDALFLACGIAAIAASRKKR